MEPSEQEPRFRWNKPDLTWWLPLGFPLIRPRGATGRGPGMHCPPRRGGVSPDWGGRCSHRRTSEREEDVQAGRAGRQRGEPAAPISDQRLQAGGRPEEGRWPVGDPGLCRPGKCTGTRARWAGGRGGSETELSDWPGASGEGKRGAGLDSCTGTSYGGSNKAMGTWTRAGALRDPVAYTMVALDAEICQGSEVSD